MTEPLQTPACLVFLRDRAGRFLLLRRNRPPAVGRWSPPGGKLDAAAGESPLQCALREVREEAGVTLSAPDLHLFAVLAERGWDGGGHWLLFLFDGRRPVSGTNPACPEGELRYFAPEEVPSLALPEDDYETIWEAHRRYRERFACLRVDRRAGRARALEVEEEH